MNQGQLFDDFGVPRPRRPGRPPRLRPTYAPSPDHLTRPCLACAAPAGVWRKSALRDEDAGHRALALCPTHDEYRKFVRAARLHNAPDDQIVKWLAAGICDWCGEPLSFKAGSQWFSRGPVIDHDHACCPDARSCGRCIRGVVHAGCNLLIGHVEQARRLVGSIDGMLRYLSTPLPYARPMSDAPAAPAEPDDEPDDDDADE